MHEIVTLQFGQQSNYIGTHYWNTQESYFTYGGQEESPVDHDISFRPGIAPDGSDTFTPRTLIYDLKGGFGSLRKINALYEVPDDPAAGSLCLTSPAQVRPNSHPNRPQIPPSPYQQHLDAGLSPPALTPQTVRYWSDYARIYHHPRSLIQLPDLALGDRLLPFENWDLGTELFESLDREHDLLDRDLRPFVEECDQLQGFQVFAGADDAWGGFAARWVERMGDEYGRKSEQQLQKLVNIAKSIHELSTQASVYVPVSSKPVSAPGYLSMDETSRWHTSGLQAAAIESMTLPSRLRTAGGQRGTLQDMEAAFNSDGNRRIAKFEFSVADEGALKEALDSRVPQMNDSRRKVRIMDAHNGGDEPPQLADFDMDLSASDFPKMTQRKLGKKTHVFGGAETSRGRWRTEGEVDADRGAVRNRFDEGPKIHRYHTSLLFPVLDSFPGIFKVGDTAGSGSLAVRSALSTSTSVADRIRNIEQVVRRLVSLDEREALCNGLQSICEEYEEGWDSESEEEDD
ncbi:mtDNA inheritance, partitioning of the mitochondrial organelle [Coniosporium tulheliwenetii]|uniref:MtDNA inheritance, partitioning of the mitochondrial organelle n=1 Tax=Coniosporium tulheliwenetii TaxID=3383036 RepID=A0ACC2YSZ2_9PEZI|nr:mtDNA inheritance, partitioning of the mitochondrial organelle [Cladosporium sp. JES 115]